MLIDRFLEDATEVDVDAIRDHTGEVLIGGVMEHVEEAGVHSGDSACAIPPQTLPPWVVEVIESYTTSIAKALDVRGLINVQYAVLGHDRLRDRGEPPRQPHGAVRRQGHGRAAGQGGHPGDARCNARRAARRGPAASSRRRTATSSIKEAVLPFNRFPEVDPALGPGDALDRRGDGHRHHVRPGVLQGRAGRRHGAARPTGTVFLSLADGDKPAGIVVARRLRELGLGIAATTGTADYLPASESASTQSSARSPTATGSTRST